MCGVILCPCAARIACEPASLIVETSEGVNYFMNQVSVILCKWEANAASSSGDGHFVTLPHPVLVPGQVLGPYILPPG